ncbi:hypothetical protein CK500_00440 [Halorubrum salipaludis]|uniref:Phosphoesterase n=1 Tax=Halorubrum salipaludis TaxID=2032630 RepID=A0A2A2FKT7_9EURY|nr:hypothetical protein [Halorubrum salipaludis]PAU85173.1 hypothetical protein CK500_00440 [Halorubrum salipaludis]
MLAAAARTYSAVFAPELFVLLCALLLVGYEWRGDPDRSPSDLAPRVGVVGIGWALAFAVYEGVPLLVDLPAWGSDLTGSVGLGVGLGIIWLGWRLGGWGALVEGFAALLVAVTVPHLLITPFWAVSSHVLYALAPAGYLFAVDRRFAPLFAAGLGMIAVRPLAGAHTWGESVGAAFLAGAFLVALLRFSPPATRPAAA